MDWYNLCASYIVENALLLDIEMSETMMGKGSFGSVFRGLFRNRDVAVKCAPKSCGKTNLLVESRILRYFLDHDGQHKEITNLHVAFCRTQTLCVFSRTPRAQPSATPYLN